MEFVAPEKLIAALRVSEGMRVADFGAGAGGFAAELVRRVGATGRVYAIDLQPALLDRAGRDADRVRRGVLHPIHTDLEHERGSTLADGSVDLVVIANLFYQLDHPQAVAAEAFRILRPGGRALLLDWSASFRHLGPPPERVVSPERAREFMEAAGFSHTEELPAGRYHYAFSFLK